MKYLLSAFVVVSLFAACKKEDKKKCWECMELTTTNYTSISSRVHHEECGKTAEEIRQYLQTTDINTSDIPDGDTVSFINTCTEKK